tara:strand:+ start:1486 stop:3558 length:2073 start_codon:yes stop_codon:yes gene_type:complete
MRIHITSFAFGNKVTEKTATPGWGSNIGNLNSKPDIYEYSKYHGLREIVNGMNKSDKTSDIANLDFAKMSNKREILQFSIFNKVFVNNKLIPDSSYTIAIVCENTKSHPGRVSLSYPGYFKYNEAGVNVDDNEKTLTVIEKELDCKEGCWFIYDISVRNEVELHFKAKVVSKNFKEYSSTAERRDHWESLINDFSDTIEKFKSYCLEIRKMKKESSVNEYIKAMPEVKTWFLESNICEEDFQIWDVYNELSYIKSKLQGELKEAWQTAAKKNEDGDYGFKMAAWNRWSEFVDWYFGESAISKSNNSFNTNKFQKACKDSGLQYTSELITRYISSLATKPFVLLSGLSGSGKTKLAQAYTQWICEDKSQYCLVPVGADWTNREPLLGYVNALNNTEYISPENGALNLLIEANKEGNEKKPYFLILDEMNLSHVERYFADFLSVMESDDKFKLHSSDTPLLGPGDILVKKEYDWPKNLFVVGTVNIDETTYMFSPKVLDRANVIEFRISEDEIGEYFESTKTLDMSKLSQEKSDIGLGASMGGSFVDIATNKKKIQSNNLNKTLKLFFVELQKVGAEFGYRTASEIQTLLGQMNEINNEYKPSMRENEKIDIAIMQKLLPKLHGSRSKLVPVLELLAVLCFKEGTLKEDQKKSIFDTIHKGNSTAVYKLSLEKITRMYHNAVSNGFTSYAEA